MAAKWAASAALLLLLLPGGSTAQGVPGGQDGSSWPLPSVGAHFGYDQAASGEVVGVQIRVPVLRGGQIELMPSASVTFVTRLREYQYNVDAVWVSGGREGGLYLGGGLALRNSIFGSDPTSPRETLAGFQGVAGLKAGGGGTLVTQVEFRWVFLSEASYDPRSFSLGVNFPLSLWGGG